MPGVIMPRDIVAEVREIIAQARPANQNQPHGLSNCRLLSQRGVDDIIRRLDAVGIRGKVGRDGLLAEEFGPGMEGDFAQIYVPPRARHGSRRTSRKAMF